MCGRSVVCVTNHLVDVPQLREVGPQLGAVGAGQRGQQRLDVLLDGGSDAQVHVGVRDLGLGRGGAGTQGRE